MGLLASRRERKINKFKDNLKSSHFSNQSISLLVPIYRNIVRLSNMFLVKLTIIIASLIIIIISELTKNDEIHRIRVVLIGIFTSIIGILVFISWILTIILLVKVISCPLKEMKGWILFWAIISFLPAIQFMTVFIMKWKIARIYKKKR